MRIWCQSGVTINPDIPENEYVKSLRKHVKRVVRPDTIIDLHGVDNFIPGRDLYQASEHFMAQTVTRNAIRAEKEGYDIYVVTCTIDPAYFAVREVINIPVVFIMETSLHLSCQLGQKFAFITHNETLLGRLVEVVKSYGLSERMSPGACMSLSYDDVHRGIYEDPGKYLGVFTQTARQAIRQGADILLLAGNPLNMFIVDQGIREIDGVPILDVCGVAVKMAELMVDLNKMGITRRRSGPLNKDILASIHKLYENQ